MSEFLDRVGYAADTEEARKINPGLMPLGEWLEKKRKFKKSQQIL